MEASRTNVVISATRNGQRWQRKMSERYRGPMFGRPMGRPVIMVSWAESTQPQLRRWF